MRMTLEKGRRDFTRRLIGYALEGGALALCEKHAGSIYRTEADMDGAYTVIRAAWEQGEISSDFESAKSQLERTIDKAPHNCSHQSCWSAKND